MYSATKFDDFILFKQKSAKFRLTLITGYMSIVLQAVEWELPVRVKNIFRNITVSILKTAEFYLVIFTSVVIFGHLSPRMIL